MSGVQLTLCNGVNMSYFHFASYMQSHRNLLVNLSQSNKSAQYCLAQHFTVMHCATLQCTICFTCTAFHLIVQHCTAIFVCVALYCKVLYCAVLLCIA